jgi:hypothetical protein
MAAALVQAGMAEERAAADARLAAVEAELDASRQARRTPKTIPNLLWAAVDAMGDPARND